MITEKFINRQTLGRLTINFKSGAKKSTESVLISKKESGLFLNCLSDYDKIDKLFYNSKPVTIAEIRSWQR